MKIYHYSNKDIRKVNVKFFGSNSYTKNDCKVSDIKRSFWYTDHRDKEKFINGKLYYAEIEEKEVYSLITDKEGYLKTYGYNIEDLLNRIIKLGYKGITYRNIYGNQLVNLFVDIEVKPMAINILI